MRYAAILLSRQPLRPTGITPWVRQTAAATRWIKDNDLGLISSTGMQTWELITTLASDLRIPLRLVIPADSKDEFMRECDQAIAEFSLDPATTEFLPCVAVSADADNMLIARDDLVTKTADVLIPVSCRPSGSMTARLADAERGGRVVSRQFVIEYSNRSTPIKYDVSARELNPALASLDGRYLIHWTRGVSSPWPQEKRIGFYRDIILSERWPRTAYDTLTRMLHTGTILASGRHMPSAVPTVSFSSLSPKDVVPLMRWRARYGEMSFEPYGIGIAHATAREIGVREVDYYDGRPGQEIPENQLWCRQSRGRITDWTAECEHRFRGDLSLTEIPRASMAIFCLTVSEAETLRREFDCPVWPMKV